MEKKEEWGDVEIPNEEQKIEIELEDDEPTSEERTEEEGVEESKEAQNSDGKGDAPELEGINTKGAEKRIRQLIRQRKERDEQITALIQKNEELSGSLRTKDKEVTQVNKLSLDASEKQLTDKLELARTVYMEAFEEGEKEKLLKAQEMLNEAQADLKAVTSAKQNYEVEEVAPVKQEPQYQPPSQQATDPRAEEWAARNTWFGQDNIKTAAALAIDAELKSEGYDPTDNDFYQEIDKRINKAFSQNIEETTERVQDNTSPPAQVVSGSSRSSSSSSNKVKLSKEDVRLAQKWNIPLEQYAAEKLKVSDADGNYTNVT
jgi:hypothetical protein